MGRDFYEKSPAARKIFDRAAEILGSEFLEVIFEGPDERLRDTRNAQPALVAVEVAIARHLRERDIVPDAVAGHSVGELAALVVAKSLPFADALQITRERARLMYEGVPEGGMAAVLGLGAEQIEAALPEGAEVANYNGPRQTIISGSASALERARETLGEAGAKRVLPLKVSGPFHSTYMSEAAERFRTYLNAHTLAGPEIEFISSVSGRKEEDATAIKELLWQQLYRPVRWTGVMEVVGNRDAIEAGPGTVLQGLAKRMPGGPVVRTASSLDEVEALRAL